MRFEIQSGKGFPHGNVIHKKQRKKKKNISKADLRKLAAHTLAEFDLTGEID
jgi:hypothetical protein